ncbi:glycoside hydrolase family 19 protein [Janthinobacterium sp.]|uniref:glycoside hydrolase family 19 protein n=1 Tax=Janthinobacterium sp. TaxID=1871054 RepID=UPI00293D6A50|nr:glycoside hydrolase family 19 protein [Janthinobacterium sp.]
MNLTQLLTIMPLAGARGAGFLDPLNAAMAEFNISTPVRQASFLSQAGHESGQLSATVENLNYGAPGLLTTFPTRFSAGDAAAYARQPERIANRAYANRIGNGDEASGDGWRFRGRGLIQITGRAAYIACGAALGYDLLANPQFLEVPALAARSAAWWWSAHGCNALADAGDQTAVTRRVNGGTNGLVERLALFAIAQQVLA